MSNTLRFTLRSLYSPLKHNVMKLPPFSSQTRYLYAKASLGIDAFKEQAQQIKHQMENIEEKFFEKMHGYADDSKSMIFTEDLKNMAYLAKSDADLDLVVKMAKKFNGQNKQLRFGNFVFGPVLMRLFYIHNKADLAVECFKSSELDGFFDQLITYQIILDLLYENEKYQEVLDMFDIIRGRQLQEARHPRNAVVLVMAACYKMNSKESIEYALKLWNELTESGHFPMRRATTFLAGLALNQGRAEVALEIIAAARKPNYVTVRNIKARALSEIGRVEDAVVLLKSIISEDQPGGFTQTFNRDIVECVKKAVLEANNPEISLEFNRLEKLFEKEGHISDTTLDSHLCSEIQKPPIMNNRQFNRFSRYNPDQSRQQVKSYRPPLRPGLGEMV